MKKNKSELSTFCERVQGVSGYYNSFSTIIRLLFIKYILTYTDRLLINEKEDFDTILRARRHFDAVKNGLAEFDIQNVFSLLKIMDSMYSNETNNIKFSSNSHAYRELFDGQKAKIVLSMLDDLHLPDDSEEIKNVLESLLEYSVRDVSMTLQYSTNKSLRLIATSILNVSKEDKYLDCYCGLSTSILNTKEFKSYVGIELNSEIASLSYMLLIMTCRYSFEVINDNFLFTQTENSADKIFCDGPIGLKFPGDTLDKNISNKYGTTDLDVVSVRKAYESLKQDGIAVVTVPGKTLFSERNAFIQLRKGLINEGLKAVISLPSLWRASVPTNILVLKKGYKGNIQFILADRLGNKINRAILLTDDDVNRIVVSYEKENKLAGFSSVVARTNINNEKFNLVPSNYVQLVNEVKHRSVKEIDNELKALYKTIGMR